MVAICRCRAESRVATPVILFAPCFVLADGAGTDLALALVAGVGSLWPVERLQRLVGVSRFGSAGAAVDPSAPLGFPRCAAIAGPCGAVSRSGQPGLLAIRCRPLDHPRRAVNRWFRAELLPVFLPGGGLHVRVTDPGV